MNIVYRRGTPADSPQTFEVFRLSILDLGDRLGVMPISGGGDPQVLRDLWRSRQPLFEHLARTSDNFWVADQAPGQIVGFARSILRDGARQLTEFFVRPDFQSKGVGRELLQRAFPADDSRVRFILGTIDSRALRRYLRMKVYPVFPCFAFSRTAEKMTLDPGLVIERISLGTDGILTTLNDIDREVLGFQREPEHTWLLENREGYLYRTRENAVLGYGYLGALNGPFALRVPGYFPAVLAHAENVSAARAENFSVEVPMVNRTAVDYLLDRGCIMDTFFEFFMADEPFGRFENYILTSPPFFV